MRQGCPLSALLFVIYMNVILHKLDHLLSQHGSVASQAWAFIDDILVRVPTSAQVKQAFESFDGPVRMMGLDMNISKTEGHAIEPSTPFETDTASGKTLSTYDKHGQPHTAYKYLGIWIFTHRSAPQLFTFLQREILGFFDALASLPLTFIQYVLLVNKQLIPILTYHSLAHRLAHDTIQLLQKIIWNELCSATPLCKNISPIDVYVPRKYRGLALRSLEIAVHKTTFYSGLRHLNRDSLPEIHDSLRQDLLSSEPNLFLDGFVETCHFMRVLAHGFGPPWNPSLVRHLSVGDQIQALMDTDDGESSYYTGEVIETGDRSTTVQFNDAQLDIQDSDDYIMHDPNSPPNDFKSLQYLCSPLYSPPNISPSAPPPPLSLQHPETCRDGILFRYHIPRPILQQKDLLF